MNKELVPRILRDIFPERAPHAADPELLYVECERCGRPVLWERGRTTDLLRRAGIDPELLDSGCLIVSRGCASCAPGEIFYETRVVRVAETSYLTPSVYSGEGGVA